MRKEPSYESNSMFLLLFASVEEGNNVYRCGGKLSTHMQIRYLRCQNDDKPKRHKTPTKTDHSRKLGTNSSHKYRT